MDKIAPIEQGAEVLIIGPTIWGSYIRQGMRGTITGTALGGLQIRMNSDGHTITYPTTSLYKLNQPKNIT